MDVVSSYRAKAYCDHLYSFGIKPTLLTHRWERAENGFVVHDHGEEAIVEEKENCRIIRLPHPGKKRSRSPLHTIRSYLNGDLDVELTLSYEAYRSFLWKHLKRERYDLVIGIYSPHFHLRIAYECWKRFGIPYVLDFRDLWENDIITPSYRPQLRERVVNFLISTWWKKWLRNCLFFSTTGTRWKEYLSRLTPRPGVIVRNGFDEIQVWAEGAANNRVFKVVHFGRMYPNQRVDVFLAGFNAFAAKHSPEEVRVEVIGLKKTMTFNHEERLRKSLGAYLTIIPYMARGTLLSYCKREATLFFFPNFKEDNGQFPVKLYDYTMLRKPTIVTPAGGDIADFITTTGSGVALPSSEDVTKYLEQQLTIFKQKGYVPSETDVQMLAVYSRRNQVMEMATAINSAIGKPHG